MPACPLTSQPSHHQSPPSHRIYRKPSVRLSRHVTSRHVTSPVDVVRCGVATCIQHTTAQQPKTTVSVRRRCCRSTASARDCHLRKERKKEPKRCFFSLLSLSPVVALQKIVLNRNIKKNRLSLHCGILPFDHHYYYYYYSSNHNNHHHHHHQPTNRPITGCCDLLSSALRFSFSPGDGGTHRLYHEK